MRPSAGAVSPHSAVAKSTWPWPSRPARPMISPARSVREIGCDAGRSRTSTTSTTASPGAPRGRRAEPFAAGVSSARSAAGLPAICTRISRGDVSAIGPSATVVPSRSTVTRSASCTSSSMRCDVKSTERPAPRASRRYAKRRSRWLSSRAEVPSSSTSSRHGRTMARAMVTSWRCASESVQTGRSTPTSSAPMAVSATRASRSSSARRRPKRKSPSVPMKMFSRTESSGAT